MTTASIARNGRDAAAHVRLNYVLEHHHAALISVARRWTGSADDAEDVVQRALEIYLRRLDHVNRATEFAWLKVVVRNEALAVRRARAEAIPMDGDDLAARLPSDGIGVDERIERGERSARSLEALARLKADERTALLMCAEGFSYREIGERHGWTYTKVNRAITEGRRRFLETFSSIDDGSACERYAPTLLSLVEGAASAAELITLRPHLRHCSTCRATVRELQQSRGRRIALFFPVIAGIVPARWLGAAAEHTDAPHEYSSGARAAAQGLLNRIHGSDVGTSLQMASSGGGRGTAVAALLSLCIGGGAGTYCLTTGALPDPSRIVRPREAPERQRSEVERSRDRGTPTVARAAQAAPVIETVRRPVVTATPVPTRAPRAETPPRRRRASSRASSAPQAEFSFESQAAGSSSTDAGVTANTASSEAPSAPTSSGATSASSPPPTSGGEFLP